MTTSTLPTMIHGSATVEIVDSRCFTPAEQVAGDLDGYPLNVWRRREVIAFEPDPRNAGAMFYTLRSGASSWVPAGNWRNFARESR